MYTMKEVCDKVDLSYETLRYYCNEGLIPNVKRDLNNYRLFDERDVKWIEGLQCLRLCGLSIKELKFYLDLSLKGESTIHERKAMLNARKEILLIQQAEILSSIHYIETKNQYFDDILNGKIEYSSNLIEVKKS